MSKTAALFATVDWKRAILVSLLSSGAYTLVKTLLIGNPFDYGAVVLPDSSSAIQLALGVLTVLFAGFLYGFIYCIFFWPIQVLDSFFKWFFWTLACAYLTIAIMPGSHPVNWLDSIEKLAELGAKGIVLIWLYQGKRPGAAAGVETST